MWIKDGQIYDEYMYSGILKLVRETNEKKREDERDLNQTSRKLLKGTLRHAAEKIH
jgi:hypothetical protein